MKLLNGLLGLAAAAQYNIVVQANVERFLRSAGDLAHEINKDHEQRHIREKRDGEEENHLGYMVNFQDISVGEEDFTENFGEFVIRNYKDDGFSFMYLEIPESLSEDAILDIRSKAYVESVEHELQYHPRALYWNKGRVSTVDNSGNYVGNLDFEGNDDHPEFENRIDRDLSQGFGRSDTYDCLGHGTSVAGVAAGANTGFAGSATLVSYALLNCDNKMSSQQNVVDALVAVKADIQNSNLPHVNKVVINMSLGPSSNAATETTIKNVESQLAGLGAVIVRAAGNNEDNACKYGLSGLVNSITVGSSAPNDERAEHSNYGSCVDIFAPGINITFPMYQLYEDSSRAYGWGTGTSFAAPQVAGVAAAIMGNQAITGNAVWTKILTMSTKNKLKNRSGSPGITNNKLLFYGHAKLYHHSGNKRLYRYAKTYKQNYVADCPVDYTLSVSTLEACAVKANDYDKNTFEYKLYRTSSNCIVKTCDLVFEEIENPDSDANPGGVLLYT
eukprot:Awhi_evm1s11215